MSWTSIIQWGVFALPFFRLYLWNGCQSSYGSNCQDEYDYARRWSYGGVHHHDGLLNVNGIWEGRFDVILTNPPFGARIDKELKITEADRFTDIERNQGL